MGASVAEAKADGAPAAEWSVQALGMLQQALAALDDGGAPADIGAHVDQAIVRLKDFLSQSQN